MQADAYEVEQARIRRLAESELSESLDQGHGMSREQFGFDLRRKQFTMSSPVGRV
jgi:hypothetical protein